jgi:hypothetical protein
MRPIVMLAALVGTGVASVATRPQSSPPAAATPPAEPQGDGIVVVGPRQEDDIVVTAAGPVIRGGLWRFRRSGTMNYGVVGGRFSQQTSLPFSFISCLPEGTLVATLRRASGERSSLLSGVRCNDLTLTVDKGRIAGRRVCTGGPGGVRASTDISGRYDSRQLSIMFALEQLHDGHQGIGGEGWNPERPKGNRWQVVAVREGDCPATPVRNQRNAEEIVPLLFTPAINYQEFDGIPKD